jgi:hypothetical protein
MPKFNAPLDMTRSEIRNARTQNLSTAPSAVATDAGLRYFDTPTKTERYWDGTRWVDLTGGWTTPTAPIDMGGQRIINVGTPTTATDAATKGYVDGVAQGLDVKLSVRVGATTNVTLATPGATIDGVTLVAGDRVLLMGQTAGAENGVYVWNGAAVAMTRATDADTSAEVTAGLFTFVSEGTANGNKGFVLTTDDPIVLGTTALTFTQFTGAGTYIGTANRITITGTQIDIAATYTGQASITTLGTIGTGTWQGTGIGIAYGGTGATTAAAARVNLGATGKYTTTIGGATTFTLTHGLNSTYVTVEIFEVTGGATVYADVKRTDANTVVIDGFTAPGPSANSLGVVIQG